MRPSELNGSTPGPPARLMNGHGPTEAAEPDESAPMTPRERDEKKEKRLDRLGKRKSIGISTPGGALNSPNVSIQYPPQTPARGLTPGLKGRPPATAPLSVDELHRKYENALAKYAQNQINTRTAFDDEFLEIFSQFSENAIRAGQADYKVLSGVLELGTAHYGYRVDNVHSEAQRVASGLTMALSNEKTGEGQDANGRDAENGEANGEQNVEDEEAQRKKKRERTRRNVKTVTDNPDSLNQARTEMSVEDHPLIKRLERFRSSQEETSVHLLLLTHLELGASCDLMLDANAVRDKLPDELMCPPGKVSLRPFAKILNDVEREDQVQMRICPLIATFDFSNRDTSMWDSTRNISDLPSQRFDVDQPYEDELLDGSFCGDGMEMDDNFLSGDMPNASIRPRKSLREVMNVDDYLNLIKKDATDYTFVDQRLWFASFGPTHWKANQFAKAQQARATAGGANGEPAGAQTATRRSKRIEFQQIDFEKADLSKLKEPKKKPASTKRKNPLLTQATLNNKWDKRDERSAYIPHDHSYSVLSCMHPHLLPEYTFHCETKSMDEVNESIRDDHDYDQMGSPRNFDHDDDDDGIDFVGEEAAHHFDDEPAPTDGILTGDNLIENPWTSQNLDINYATQAKRIDVKQLKSAIWRVVSTTKEAGTTPERNKSSGEPPEKSPKEDADSKFTEIYTTIKSGDIAMSRVVPSHVSYPIAFCTLLHLANEHSLELEAQSDLSDFKIKLSSVE